MADENYFWAAVLDSKNKSVEWNPESDFTKDDKDPIVPQHSLNINSAVLSHTADDGEVAAVEVETKGYSQSVYKSLVAVMLEGKGHRATLDLNFGNEPVKLNLVKGSGPVHLVGTHSVTFIDTESTDDEEEDTDDNDDDEEEASDEEEAKSEPAPVPVEKVVEKVVEKEKKAAPAKKAAAEEKAAPAKKAAAEDKAPAKKTAASTAEDKDKDKEKEKKKTVTVKKEAKK